MALLQKQFKKFEENIRLNDIEDNEPLLDKRNMLIKELQEWGKKNDKPSFDWFNQGSYHMSTGIKPQEDEDHDIDVAIVYNVNIKDEGYKDPTKLKKWVRDGLNIEKREVTIMNSCVRVQYRHKGEVQYHVDFAIYGKEFNDNNEEVKKHLAKGKEFAYEEKKFWEEAQPKELRKLIKEELFKEDEELGGTKRAQFRRIVKYLKRWKDRNFTSGGDARPTGIAMTAICYEWFQPYVTKDWEGNIEEKDMLAFKDLVSRCIDNNYGLDVKLPVMPKNELFQKLKKSDYNIQAYKDKLLSLCDALVKAYNETDPHEAAKAVKKAFNNDEDFPVPDKEYTAKVTIAPAITTSSASA
jgi:hypothetical protein